MLAVRIAFISSIEGSVGYNNSDIKKVDFSTITSTVWNNKQYRKLKLHTTNTVHESEELRGLWFVFTWVDFWNMNNINNDFRNTLVVWWFMPLMKRLRWLDWIFWGGLLPSLSIYYVTINKDIGKISLQLYCIMMKVCYDLYMFY